jgi:hypothetical protein
MLSSANTGMGIAINPRDMIGLLPDVLDIFRRPLNDKKRVSQNYFSEVVSDTPYFYAIKINLLIR